MPYYIFQHPTDESRVIEVFQNMKDEHIFIDEDGIKWNRIFTSPMAIVDGKIDAFSPQDFVKKTSNKKGTMGDLWDRSRELSEKRAAQNGGVDPIRKKAEKEWSKKRNGKQLPKTFSD